MKSSLTLNPNEPAGALKRVWEFGFNTCHAPIVLRSDLQKHLRTAHDTLRMKYWRCHGTLSDDVGIVSENAAGQRQYTFSGLKRILDAALATGVKPFLELSFMPSALARDPKQTICHYRGITSPPKEFAAWGELISRTARFLVDTYGVDDVRSWYFEVWNEPNIPFWQGTQAEYFELYRQAALAIKGVDSRLRVGGPATARAAWVRELLQFCRDSHTPVDFVSTHIYPSDVEFVESAHGSVQLLGVDFLYEHFGRVQREVAEATPGLPIIWGEWNSSAGPYATNHDDANNAALVAAALAGIEEYADGSLYWNLSDIYEEVGHFYAPFQGAYGLYTVDDIPKSAARAFELFTRLGDRRVAVTGVPESKEQGALTSVDTASGECRVILWNHAESADSLPWEVDVAIAGAGSRGTLTTIRPGAGSAYETWLEMGSPPNLTAAQHRRLLQASEPDTCELNRAGAGFNLRLAPGTAALLTV